MQEDLILTMVKNIKPAQFEKYLQDIHEEGENTGVWADDAQGLTAVYQIAARQATRSFKVNKDPSFRLAVCQGLAYLFNASTWDDFKLDAEAMAAFLSAGIVPSDDMVDKPIAPIEIPLKVIEQGMDKYFDLQNDYLILKEKESAEAKTGRSSFQL